MKKRKFDVERFLDQTDFDELTPSALDCFEEPKDRRRAKCPHCGSLDWWKVYRNKYGKITRCTECPNE